MRTRDKEHNLVEWAQWDFVYAERELAEILAAACVKAAGAEEMGKALWLRSVEREVTVYEYLKRTLTRVNLPLRP